MSPRIAYPDARTAALGVVQRNADAIEHALHQGRLTDLGLCSDAEVLEQIQASLDEAGVGRYAMAALAAADYCDSPELPALFTRRRQAALWRACQLLGVEDEYWTLIGRSPYQVPAPVLQQLGCIDPHCTSQGPFDLPGGVL